MFYAPLAIFYHASLWGEVKTMAELPRLNNHSTTPVCGGKSKLLLPCGGEVDLFYHASLWGEVKTLPVFREDAFEFYHASLWGEVKTFEDELRPDREFYHASLWGEVKTWPPHRPSSP